MVYGTDHGNKVDWRFTTVKTRQQHTYGLPQMGCSMIGPALPLRWRHNDHAGVSNHQPHGCLLNRLFRRNSKKTSKLRVTGLCAGNSPGTGEFPAQMASYAENVSIWWRHHAMQEGRVTWAETLDFMVAYHSCTHLSENRSKILVILSLTYGLIQWASPIVRIIGYDRYISCRCIIHITLPPNTIPARVGSHEYKQQNPDTSRNFEQGNKDVLLPLERTKPTEAVEDIIESLILGVFSGDIHWVVIANGGAINAGTLLSRHGWKILHWRQIHEHRGGSHHNNSNVSPTFFQANNK